MRVVSREAAEAVAAVQPTMMDRFVAYLDPVRGSRRLEARRALALSGAISGAGGYVSGRSEKSSMQRYNPSLRSAQSAIHPGLSKIRARSRDQSRNNPLAAGAINNTVTGTVGSGLTVQSQIDHDVLGLTDEQADAWEANAQRIWELWAGTRECDVEDELTFSQIQSLFFRAVLESGDILRLRRFLWDFKADIPKRGGHFGTKVQLVEADRISNPNYGMDTDRLQAGVEVDGDGLTVQYWVQNTHPGDHIGRRSDSWKSIPAWDATTGQRIAHLSFAKRRPGQRRGIPYLAPVIEALKQLERYTDAELMAAVVSAMFTVFVKSDVPAEEGGALSNMGDEVPEDPEDLFMGNGAVVDLDPGDDVEFADPSRPNAGFDLFITSILRQVGVALEIPFEILIKHFQSSYSASRGAMLEAFKFYRTRRKWLVENLCQPCYEDVISEAVARGMLDAPGFFDNKVIQRAWLGTEWTGDAMPQLDPLKEGKAAEVRINAGLSTRDRESRELNGTTFAANHRQLKKETQKRRAAGLEAGLATSTSGRVEASVLKNDSTAREELSVHR